jgi:hypothetical protein
LPRIGGNKLITLTEEEKRLAIKALDSEICEAEFYMGGEKDLVKREEAKYCLFALISARAKIQCLPEMEEE